MGFPRTSETGDPIPYLNVYYDGKGVGTITDIDGKYSIAAHAGWNKLTFSMVGSTLGQDEVWVTPDGGPHQ